MKMGLKKLFISTAIQLLLTSIAVTQESSRSHYAEPCNKFLRCETNSMLTCKNGTCDCLKPESMYYDPFIKSCLVLVGEKCRYPVVIDSNEDISKFSWIPQKRRDLMEEMDCVQNAWCNSSGFCMCSAGDYIELGNGTCINRRNYEEACVSNVECRQDRFLSCISGRCGCNETNSAYNVLLRQCVGKVGYPCIGVDACVYNAECTTSIKAHRRARQSVKMCTCSSGFVADSNGFCRVGLGLKCNENQKCSPNFKCMDGICTCPFQNLQVAHIRSQSCMGLVGAPCNNSNSSYCVANANCLLNNETAVYECQCEEGFIESMDGHCDLAYGSSCTVSAEIDPPTYNPWKIQAKCDRLAPLYCVDGLCECESDLYTFNGTSCLGKHGAKCEKLKRECIEGAQCMDRRGTGAVRGRCLCSIDDGYVIGGNRTCLKL